MSTKVKMLIIRTTEEIICPIQQRLPVLCAKCELNTTCEDGVVWKYVEEKYQ